MYWNRSFPNKEGGKGSIKSALFLSYVQFHLEQNINSIPFRYDIFLLKYKYIYKENVVAVSLTLINNRTTLCLIYSLVSKTMKRLFWLPYWLKNRGAVG